MEALPPPPPPASQASSHFALEPIPADVLFDRETSRRDALRSRGTCRVGCGELDDHALLGGFERGIVVGISSEDDGFALLMALQVVARELVGDETGRAAVRPRAMVVTTQPSTSLLPVLRDVIRDQAAGMLPGHDTSVDVSTTVRACLESISISRVFDIDGLWEVLGELDLDSAAAEADTSAPTTETREVDDVPTAQPPPGNVRVPKELHTALSPSVVIQDSEDEGGLSSLSSSPLSDPPELEDDEFVDEASRPGTAPSVPDRESQQQQQQQQQQPTPLSSPSIIIITHLSALLSALFTTRDKATAHSTLQLLSSHLRYLSRMPSGPLIMLLNSTSAPAPFAPAATPTGQSAPNPNPHATPHHHHHHHHYQHNPPDPTLRSVFPTPGRRTKPAFGLLFAQLLDQHLLCTRLPRARADAEALMLCTDGGGGGGPRAVPVRYVWVVEVLLDEMGVWEEEGGHGGAAVRGRRRCREQRWGAVDVHRGVRVVDAFDASEKGPRPAGEIRLAAGFGGPRV